MRKERELAGNVWYLVNTSANNGEPLFQSEFGVWLFGWTVSEAKERYAFEMRGVRFAGSTVSFFIKPANGLQLPDIMKWIKQTFALRFNWDDGRTGHIWGDRYGSEILPGEPPEWAEVYVFMEIDRPVRRGDWKRDAARRGLGKKAGNANAANRTRRADPGYDPGRKKPAYQPVSPATPVHNQRPRR
jgi:hypothetical protein